MDTRDIYDLLPSSLFNDIFFSNECEIFPDLKTSDDASTVISASSDLTTEGSSTEKSSNRTYCAGTVQKEGLPQSMYFENLIPTQMNTPQTIIHSDFYLQKLECQLPYILKTQKGSALFQNLIGEIRGESLNELLGILSPHWVGLMCSSFAHSFCIEFFKHCNPNQKICLLSSIKSNFHFVITTFFGSLTVQNMIELIGDDNLITSILLDSLRSSNEILMLCKNTFGCHVIEKMISCISEDRRTKLNSVLIANFGSLAVNMNGVLILKQLLHHCIIDVNKDQITQIISNEFLKLSQNQYANYIVQEFLELKIHDSTCIAEKLVEKYFTKLATHRISSYVIEKFLVVAKKKDVNRIFQRLKRDEKLSTLIQNKYGQIILEKMIACFHCEM